MKQDYYIEWFLPYIGIRYAILKDCDKNELLEYLNCLSNYATDIKIEPVRP